MDNKIFTLIKGQEEKIKLWQDLALNKGEILCKGKEDFLCKLRISFYNSKTQCLECNFESTAQLKHQEEYLGYFFLGGEKYYFQAVTNVHQGKVVVDLPQELYHLQRRQNYRVHIPEKYPASFNITFINDVPQKVIGRLADLSSQGCRVVSPSAGLLIKPGDRITGMLAIDKRAPIEAQGLVRHIKMVDNKALQTFGVEFTPLTPILENKLFAITLEIHKQLFHRPS